jgi:dTMP kinase
VTAPFIVLEGPEGSGKSLQSRLLAEFLERQGWKVLLTREPGGTKLGDALRAILLSSDDYAILPEAEVLLLAAARAQHVRERIRPALERGTAVVCDRFVDSTLAYQGGGHGIPHDVLRPIQTYATGGLTPDLRILLDVPVDVGLQRRHANPASVNRIDLASREFHCRVRRAFLDLAAAHPDDWCVLDGQESLESVAAHIRAEVMARVLPKFTMSAAGLS